MGSGRNVKESWYYDAGSNRVLKLDEFKDAVSLPSRVVMSGDEISHGDKVMQVKKGKFQEFLIEQGFSEEGAAIVSSAAVFVTTHSGKDKRTKVIIPLRDNAVPEKDCQARGGVLLYNESWTKEATRKKNGEAVRAMVDDVALMAHESEEHSDGSELINNSGNESDVEPRANETRNDEESPAPGPEEYAEAGYGERVESDEMNNILLRAKFDEAIKTIAELKSEINRMQWKFRQVRINVFDEESLSDEKKQDMLRPLMFEVH